MMRLIYQLALILGLLGAAIAVVVLTFTGSGTDQVLALLTFAVTGVLIRLEDFTRRIQVLEHAQRRRREP